MILVEGTIFDVKLHNAIIDKLIAFVRKKPVKVYLNKNLFCIKFIKNAESYTYSDKSIIPTKMKEDVIQKKSTRRSSLSKIFNQNMASFFLNQTDFQVVFIPI